MKLLDARFRCWKLLHSTARDYLLHRRSAARSARLENAACTQTTDMKCLHGFARYFPKTKHLDRDCRDFRGCLLSESLPNLLSLHERAITDGNCEFYKKNPFEHRFNYWYDGMSSEKRTNDGCYGRHWYQLANNSNRSDTVVIHIQIWVMYIFRYFSTYVLKEID